MSETAPTASDPLTRAERLDRLPFTSQHAKLLVGSGVGWALDAMDVGLISFVMAALAAQWKLDNDTLSWIGSIGFVGMALGASLGGLLADRIGRRNVFAVTLLIYGLATGASALVGSVAALMVLRFLVGLGLGAREHCRAATSPSSSAWPRLRRPDGSASSLPRSPTPPARTCPTARWTGTTCAASASAWSPAGTRCSRWTSCSTGSRSGQKLRTHQREWLQLFRPVHRCQV